MTTIVTFSTSAFVLILAATSVSLSQASQERILDSTRQADSAEEYCNRGVSITNDIRRRYQGKGKYVGQGQGDLVVGTVSMLDNCLSHSKLMADRHANGFNNFQGSQGHQNLGDATEKVGCGLFINGENIAMFSASMATDPAVQCMKQWEESEGHLDNIMRQKEGDYVAVGVYNDGERWWCTQTFAYKGDGSCPRVGGSSESGAAADPGSRSGPVDTTTAPADTVTSVTSAPASTTTSEAIPETASPRKAAPTTTAVPTTAAPSVVPVSSVAPTKPAADHADPKTVAPSSGRCKGSADATTSIDSETTAPSGSAPKSTEPDTAVFKTTGPTTTAPKTTEPATPAPAESNERAWKHYGSYGRRGGMYGYYPYRK